MVVVVGACDMVVVAGVVGRGLTGVWRRRLRKCLRAHSLNCCIFCSRDNVGE